MKTIKTVVLVGLLLLSLLAVSFVVTKKQIENSLIKICDAAAEKYDCLPRKALKLQLSDNSIDPKTMNRTIWAIGKMKIETTLPKLEMMYRNTESLNYNYSDSKRELEKAINYMKFGKMDLMTFDELYN
ncbi:MAG: hypothetical protein PF541_09825 [Prolixibacteraceae bacterium]|jgi:hypothetical protein|nr:hypothetical protein [Prolixibacteraceae bacterium]